MKSIYCLIAFGFLASGCGGSDEPELGVVTGEVIQAGSPVPGALVEFFPEAGVTSTAITDSEGKYSLRYNDREGAIVGTHQVQVTPGASADMAPDPSSDQVAPPLMEPPQTVVMPDKVTVTTGENLIDITLPGS